MPFTNVTNNTQAQTAFANATAGAGLGEPQGGLNKDDHALWVIAEILQSLSDLGTVGGTTVFATNRITETRDNGKTIATVFNADGTITTTETTGGVSHVTTTTFNADGSITEVVT